MANNEIIMRRADNGSQLFLNEGSINGLTTKLNGIVNSIQDAKKVADAADSLSKTLQSTITAIQDILNISYDGNGGVISIISELTEQDTRLSEAIDTLRSGLNETIDEIKAKLGDNDNTLQRVQSELQTVSNLTDSVNETARDLQSQIGNPLDQASDSIYGRINNAQSSINTVSRNVEETQENLGNISDIANQAIKDVSSITIKNLFKFSKNKHKFSNISAIRAKVVDGVDKTTELGYSDTDILPITQKLYPDDVIYVIPEEISLGYNIGEGYIYQLRYHLADGSTVMKRAYRYIVPESPKQISLPVSYSVIEDYLVNEYLTSSHLAISKKGTSRRISLDKESSVIIGGVSSQINAAGTLPKGLYYGIARQRIGQYPRSFKNRNHVEQRLYKTNGDVYTEFKEKYSKNSRNSIVKYHAGDTIIKGGAPYIIPKYKSISELNKDFPYFSLSGLDKGLKFKGTKDNHLFSFAINGQLSVADCVYQCKDQDGNVIKETVNGESVERNFKKTYYSNQNGTSTITIEVPDYFYIAGINILSRKYYADGYYFHKRSGDSEARYYKRYMKSPFYNEHAFLTGIQVNGKSPDNANAISTESPIDGFLYEGLEDSSTYIDTSKDKTDAYAFRGIKWNFSHDERLKSITITVAEGVQFSSIEVIIGSVDFLDLKEEITHKYILNAEKTVITPLMYYSGEFAFTHQRFAIFIYKQNKYDLTRNTDNWIDFQDSSNISNILPI